MEIVITISEKRGHKQIRNEKEKIIQ